MPDLYALLIGIDDYDDRPVNGISYPKLSGAVRDINHVHAFLRDTLKVGESHVLKLTAPRAGSGAPEGDWPTYANLVRAFQRLGEIAQPGDQVYIHYSGHGGRAATVFPHLKGERGFDEALVPVDIGDPSAQYLRDVELHTLLKSLTANGLVVTVVFDSCHSGGATRGLGQATPRGIDRADAVVRPHVSAVDGVAVMERHWQADAAATRGVKPASGWLVDTGSYTFLAACRASESAYEYPFNGAERNGALTWFLLDVLRRAASTLSYSMIMDRVVGQVHGLFAQQTPMLQGDGDRRIFASDRIDTTHAVRVLEFRPDGKIRLQAGEAHGIAPGANFRLFAFDADLTDVDARIGVAEVKEVSSAECSAELIEVIDPNALDAGNLAVPVGGANVRVQYPVRVVMGDAVARSAIEDAIMQQGKGFVVVAAPEQPPAFQVLRSEDALSYELCDPAGQRLPCVPSIACDHPAAASQLVARLVHLAKYRAVAALIPLDGESAAKLDVELVDSPAPVDGRVVYRPGDTVKLRITNRQPPAGPNDPARILNITALDLASDWSITQVHPADSGDFESLDPGQHVDIEFDAYLPEGVDTNSDRIKVFATRDTTDFRWLQLPALDEPAEQWISKKRSAGDPLAALHEQLAEDRVTTRSLVIKSKPRRTWTVGEVELHVARA